MEAATRTALLTEAFYSWEQRGRGWLSSLSQVQLEPPFEPFGRCLHPAAARPTLDDARKPHWLAKLWSSFWSAPDDVPTVDSDAALEFEEGVPVEHWEENELRASTSGRFDLTGTSAWFASQAACRHIRAFEVIGTQGMVSVRLAASRKDSNLVFGQVPACFPAVAVTEPIESIRSLWHGIRGTETIVLEFGLAREFMIPLRTPRLDPDPLAGIIGALALVEKDQLGMIQLLFDEVGHPWGEHILRAVTTPNGDAFFADAPEITKLAQEKISTPLYAVILRVAAKAEHQEQAWEIIRQVATTLGQFGSPDRNEIIPLAYGDSELVPDLLNRTTHRCGMIWSTEELECLVHPPSPSIRCEQLARGIKQTKAAPSIALNNSFVLGDNEHAGKKIVVGIREDQRLRHTYLIGASGTGKSTMLLNMIDQDIAQGSGVAVLDPHGDLIDQIISRIPVERAGDVVLFDPSDEEFPISFNVLSAHSAIEKNLLSSDLVAVFRRLSTSWGDQMNSVLGNAILAFLESRQGGNLADLRRFLVDIEYRRRFLETVDDEEVVFYWQKEFPVLTGRPQGPILTRLDTFLRPKLVRNMICQQESKLDLGRIMNGGKIVLAKLAQGAIGEENSYLLGSLLVSKFYQHALSRQELNESARRPFYLYIDECHHFVTPSMASILSGARKYKLGLVLANQELRQLGSRDSDVLQSVLTNPCTRICFRVGDDDARKLADGFSTFQSDDLLNLGVGEAISRIDQAQNDFNLKVRPTVPVDPVVAAERHRAIRESSRRNYAGISRSKPAEVDPVITRKFVEPGPQPRRPVEKSLQQIVRIPVPTKDTDEPQQETVVPLAPRSPGRGGAAHKYLQELLKRWAEQHGFKVTLELPVLDGLGYVDVALERNGRRVACEICITTAPNHEAGNLQKCLAAGFETVVVVIPDRQKLKLIQQTVISSLEESLVSRVHFLAPEQVFTFLEAGEPEAPPEKNVRGYRVKVGYKSTPNADQAIRRQAIARVIGGAVKRLQPKEVHHEKSKVDQG